MRYIKFAIENFEFYLNQLGLKLTLKNSIANTLNYIQWVRKEVEEDKKLEYVQLAIKELREDQIKNESSN